MVIPAHLDRGPQRATNQLLSIRVLLLLTLALGFRLCRDACLQLGLGFFKDSNLLLKSRGGCRRVLELLTQISQLAFQNLAQLVESLTGVSLGSQL